MISKIKAWLIRQTIKKAIGGEMFTKIWAAIEGKKLYITALLVAIRGLLVAYGIVIPPWVDSLLTAFGIVAAKSAVAKLEPK
jgi:hypothetical protein